MIGKAVKAANREFSIFYTLQTHSLLLGSPWVLNTNLQGAVGLGKRTKPATVYLNGKEDR